ncbi:hypothetical protein, partial [Campylobacter sp.]|uniref:hypothetical protein n=1 Tax=Campylobacter sp. TaxID=205 RepID=UPI00360A98E9
ARTDLTDEEKTKAKEDAKAKADAGERVFYVVHVSEILEKYANGRTDDRGENKKKGRYLVF